MKEDQNKDDKHLTNKWNHLRRQLKARQILFYIAQIPVESIKEYLHGRPSNEEILRMETVILSDRREKTLRIRNGLQKYVGHLKSPQVARIIGVTDSTVRQIWSGKNDSASYEIIDKIELYLNQNFDFELSIENNLTVRKFLDNEADIIIERIFSLKDQLGSIPPKIKNVIKRGEFEYQISADFEQRYYFPTPIDNLNKIRIELEELTNSLQAMFDNFIKKE
ncbi:hypothetical protein [uncultured Draconibacterium sp.]|uniref:hypothetical protein n=1 Tax=uncultured Draconibacterium sp. TaxID=1573823 RepID=UPI0025D0310E|nr:hypothetical protein [uncultured Draconibacterium sp.]